MLFFHLQLCVSSVYQVPILLFEAYDHATGAPVTSLETLHDHLPINMASNPTHAYVTQVEHPFTERPIFAIHPCRTADIVKDLIASCQEDISRRTRSVDGEKKRTKISNKISPIYLAVWMNVYLNSLGATNVRLSSLEYKRIIDVLSSSSTITSSTSTTSTTTTTSTSTSSTTNLKGKTLSDYSVREATLFDLTTLHLFEQELIKYERPFASNLKQDPIHYYNIKDLIERKDAVLLVVEVNTSGEGGRAGRAGRLIGSGYALIKESPPHKQPNQFAYLGFMYVAPDYRGQGLNGVVMQQLIDWSKERGIVEIQLDVFAANQSALRAYEKIGFQPDLLKMRLRR